MDVQFQIRVPLAYAGQSVNQTLLSFLELLPRRLRRHGCLVPCFPRFVPAVSQCGCRMLQKQLFPDPEETAALTCLKCSCQLTESQGGGGNCKDCLRPRGAVLQPRARAVLDSGKATREQEARQLFRSRGAQPSFDQWIWGGRPDMLRGQGRALTTSKMIAGCPGS